MDKNIQNDIQYAYMYFFILCSNGNFAISEGVDFLSVHSMLPREIKREKLRVWKNLVVISMSFMFLFTAYGVTAVLQVIQLH